MRLMLAVVLLAAPTFAEELAAPPSPPATPTIAPTWSIGAGLTFFAPSSQILATGSGLGGLTTLSTTTPVSPSVSIERLFSSQFALGFGLEASLQSSSVTGLAAAGPSGSIGLGVSPRFILTNPDAPVAFTVYSTVFGGYASGGQAVLGLSGTALTSSLSFGVSGGVALELKLLERLSVRAQANLARFTLSRSRIVVSGTGTSESVIDGVGINIIPTPSLELRIYL